MLVVEAKALLQISGLPPNSHETAPFATAT